MDSKRIKEIHLETAYPESISVYKALLQVWNECKQEENENTQQLQTELKEARERIDELIINQNDVLQQLEKNESMADFVIATETVRILLTK